MKGTDFDQDQFSEAYPPGIERTWWQIARKAVVARAFERSVPRTERILEVGCGTGIVTHHLRACGWEAKGVELGTPRQGIHAAEHLMLGADATALPADFRAGITVLALFDVIEHIADAPGFLRGLLAAYPNARTVVVTVPARQELWTTFDDHFGHFRRYDRPLLQQELEAAGLSPEWSAYFFHGLYAAIALNNALRGRKRNVRFHAPAPGAASAAHNAIGRLFALEAAVLPGGLAGSSIIAVARRAQS
jgi:SAM-dependent methyltransferase